MFVFSGQIKRTKENEEKVILRLWKDEENQNQCRSRGRKVRKQQRYGKRCPSFVSTYAEIIIGISVTIHAHITWNRQSHSFSDLLHCRGDRGVRYLFLSNQSCCIVVLRSNIVSRSICLCHSKQNRIHLLATFHGWHLTRNNFATDRWKPQHKMLPSNRWFERYRNF